MRNIRKSVIALAALISVNMLFSQTPEQLRSYLPEIAGWTLADETEVFDSENLYDRIDGAAPLFLENNFVEMTSLEYKKGDDYITIQAYRHATPEDAFGMYASERSDEMEHFDFGGEAQGDATNLFFFAGSIYVKMWTNSDDDVAATLRSVGKALSEKIDAKAAYPAVTQLFPVKGKIAWSDYYITKGYIGHEFLKSVYVAKYKPEDTEFQLFVLDGKTAEGVGETLAAYFKFSGQPETDFVKDNIFIIKDKYNGDIPVLIKGQYLIGVYNDNGATVPNAHEWIIEMAKGL